MRELTRGSRVSDGSEGDGSMVELMLLLVSGRRRGEMVRVGGRRGGGKDERCDGGGSTEFLTGGERSRA